MKYWLSTLLFTLAKSRQKSLGGYNVLFWCRLSRTFGRSRSSGHYNRLFHFRAVVRFSNLRGLHFLSSFWNPEFRGVGAKTSTAPPPTTALHHIYWTPNIEQIPNYIPKVMYYKVKLAGLPQLMTKLGFMPW